MPKEAPILLNLEKIRKELDHKKLTLTLLDSIDSTNDYLKRESRFETPQICIAEYQTNPRARLGRSWYSPHAKNIYLSCSYSFQKRLSELSGLSLVVGLAMIRLLKSYGIEEQLGVKWPNDIVYQQKKLAGILVETQGGTSHVNHVIIGIGLNVNMTANETQPILKEWTSLQQILGCYVCRNELSARLINCLFNYLYLFNQQGLREFMDEWLDADILIDKIITVKNATGLTCGQVLGIDTAGHLLLKLSDDRICTFSSGDTTIVK